MPNQSNQTWPKSNMSLVYNDRTDNKIKKKNYYYYYYYYYYIRLMAFFPGQHG